MTTLVTRIQDLATRIATECKSIRTLMNGNAVDNSALTTTAKTNLVAAINELQAKLGASINDTTPSASSTYSSNKINSAIAAAVAGLVNGAPAALDTLAEIATQLAADESGAASMATAIGNRVRYDDVQNLTAAQKIQALSNIGAAALAHTHTIADVSGLQNALDGKAALADTGTLDTNFVTVFAAGL